MDDQVQDMHETDLKSGEWMDDDALSNAATPPASPRSSKLDIVCDDEKAVEPGQRLTKPAQEARETRSMSRGNKTGELTENPDPVQSLQELANSALKLAREDDSETSRDTTSCQLRQRAQKLGAITDEPPPAPTEQHIRARQYKSWTS
eukprot:2708397-Rhodomonas_salina.1